MFLDQSDPLATRTSIDAGGIEKVMFVDAGGVNNTMRLEPQMMLTTAAELGQLSDQTDQAQQVVYQSWERLDGDWEWYAEGDIRDYFHTTLIGLARMAAVLAEMKDALLKATDLIEAADLEAAGFFSDIGQAGNPQGNASKEDGGAPPPGYVNADNVGSTSPERIQDLRNILANTTSGRRLAEWLDTAKVEVVFADIKDPNVAGKCTNAGFRIILDVDYAGLPDFVLASILVHEATHSLQPLTRDANVDPSLLPIINFATKAPSNIYYLAYPYPEEYRAFRAQAEFLREVESQVSGNREADFFVDLIFDEDGGYHDVEYVYQVLHKMGYNGLVNPPEQAN